MACYYGKFLVFFDNSHGGILGSSSVRLAAAGRDEAEINKPR